MMRQCSLDLDLIGESHPPFGITGECDAGGASITGHW